VMEDQWGGAFITILNTCALSSSFPCSPSNFTIDNGLLIIRSTLRYDMKLRRVN
jgi:hypothetical protein